MSGSPVWHPFTQHGLGEPIPQVVRAEGAALHTADGRRVVDAISSWWVTTHGHGHPRIVAAIVASLSSTASPLKATPRIGTPRVRSASIDNRLWLIVPSAVRATSTTGACQRANRSA